MIGFANSTTCQPSHSYGDDVGPVETRPCPCINCRSARSMPSTSARRTPSWTCRSIMSSMGCSSRSVHLSRVRTSIHTLTHTHSRSRQFNQYKFLNSPRSLVIRTLGPVPSRCSMAATTYPRDANSPQIADCNIQLCKPHPGHTHHSRSSSANNPHRG